MVNVLSDHWLMGYRDGYYNYAGIKHLQPKPDYADGRRVGTQQREEPNTQPRLKTFQETEEALAGRILDSEEPVSGTGRRTLVSEVQTTPRLQDDDPLV